MRRRLLDDHVGGEETFALVTSEVAATADLRLAKHAKHAEDVGRRLLVALGEMCQWLPSRIDSSTGSAVCGPSNRGCGSGPGPGRPGLPDAMEARCWRY